MQFIGRRLQKFLSSMVGRFFALRIQNPVINQVREDSVEVKLIFVSGLNFAAGFIKPESIINGLSKKISALKESVCDAVHPVYGKPVQGRVCFHCKMGEPAGDVQEAEFKEFAEHNGRQSACYRYLEDFERQFPEFRLLIFMNYGLSVQKRIGINRKSEMVWPKNGIMPFLINNSRKVRKKSFYD